MILLDSNILIYLRDPEQGEAIVHHINSSRLATCNVIISKVLGFRGLEKSDAAYFERLFAAMTNYPFDDSVTRTVIELRRNHSIQLPDAIIAATAIVNNLTLWTRNTDDFNKISSLKLFDPLGSN